MPAVVIASYIGPFLLSVKRRSMSSAKYPIVPDVIPCSSINERLPKDSALNRFSESEFLKNNAEASNR